MSIDSWVRMTIRVFPTAALLVFAIARPGLAAADLSTTVQFDIGPQPLSSALLEYSEQSGVQIASSSKLLDGKHSGGVVGELPARDALERLLDGTGLKYAAKDEISVVILGVTPATGASSRGMEPKSTSFWDRLRLAQAARTQDVASTPGATGQAGESMNLTVEEIVVTAQKREERLQDVPMAVSVINTQALADTNQLRVQDYIARVPGVSFTPSGNGGEPTLVVRGIVTGTEANPTVGYVVDGVAYGASTATGPNVVTPPDIDPGDLARIEVLRGPQGTLYGAASIGGIVHFVTQQPSTEGFSGRIQVGTSTVEHGHEIGHNVRGALNVPINDELALRLSAFDLSEPGWIDNVETRKKDVNAFESKGARLGFLWRPGDYSVRLNAFVQDSAREGVSDADLAFGPYAQGFLNGTGAYERRSRAFSATIEGPLGPFALTSITGFSRDEVYNDLDTSAILSSFAESFFGVGRATTQIHRDTDKLSQEIRLVLPFGDRNELLTGIFYTEEEVLVDADNQAADISGRTFGSIFDNHYRPAEFEERALFFNLTLYPSDPLQLQFGGRVSESTQILQATFRGPLAPLFYPSNPFTTGAQETDSDSFTYAVAARYELSRDFTAYGRVATGYRPGGTNVVCGVRPGIPCQFDADTTRNYELGLKGNAFGGMLSLDLAVYFITWDNIQIPNLLVPPDFLFFYTDNVSEAESSGVEATFELRPRRGLRFWLAGAYNDAHLTAAFPTFASVPAGSGDRLPYSPRWSGNAGFDWEIPAGSAATFNIGGTVTHVGDRIANFSAVTGEQDLPAYNQIDARVGLALNDWNFTAFVNNIGDERGVLRTAFPFPNYVTYLQPRTLGLSIARNF